MRMCLLSCFNLTEAFINGIVWEFVQATDIAALSKTKQDLLTKGQASLLEKIAKVPVIVMGENNDPLAKEQEPLSTLRIGDPIACRGLQVALSQATGQGRVQ